MASNDAVPDIGPRAASVEVRFGADGLAPTIVQDAADGRVLMLGYMDGEALSATIETGEVHFHSRSRDRLWRKGESSGNVLRLVELASDCDRDALLVTVDAVGPTCHREARSCFDLDVEPIADARELGGQGFAWLETLWRTIASRASERPSGSYTTSLLEGGTDAVARKVAEEATEVLLAAKDDALHPTEQSRIAVADEVADLVYHLLVLLAERDVAPSEVIGALSSRHHLRSGSVAVSSVAAARSSVGQGD